VESPAWLFRGIGTYDATAGTLRLEGDRLRFVADGEPVFEFPLAEIEDVRYPRVNLGSVMTFTAHGKRYRLAFLRSRPRSKWSGARLSDVRPARRWGREWKTALATRRSGSG
jgi:hypothetical protein